MTARRERLACGCDCHYIDPTLGGHPRDGTTTHCGRCRSTEQPASAPFATDAFGINFAKQVEAHTAEARSKFMLTTTHLERDMPDRTFWLSVLLEEVGKLARVCNKLAIAQDADVRQTWEAEGRHRLLTVASVTRRMAEQWEHIPDEGQPMPIGRSNND